MAVHPKMHPCLLFLLAFTLPLLSSSSSSTPPPHQSHLTKQGLHHNATTQEYLELTSPIPYSNLTPSCQSPVFSHDFAYTYGLPPATAGYSPPANCTWSHAVLHLRVSSRGDQYDRIAAVWLEGAELLRTSTAEPTAAGIFWNVRKDVTRYSSLLRRSNLTLSVMLENLVNDEFTGIYHVNVTFLYYSVVNSTGGSQFRRKLGRKLGFVDSYNPIELNAEDQLNSSDLYEKPADFIIPISGTGDKGYWFRIEKESDVHCTGFEIPPNTYRAVMEVYVSFHGDDEFWYSNPPDSYIQMNNLSTGRGSGAYREVLLLLDGNIVGSVVPFPVIFTGGINPLFWEPVVAIGAFNLPSYDIDLTPFLGMLLDGNIHSLGLAVVDGISFWLVDGNLHLWLDQGSSSVQAKAVDYSPPRLEIERESKFKGLDGSAEVEMERKSEFSGWVNSTAGNFTTRISQELEFENKIKFSKSGTVKSVKQKVKVKREIRVETSNGSLIYRDIVKRKYPLRISTATQPGVNGTHSLTTNVDHSYREERTAGDSSSTLINSQQSDGWMAVQDHNVLAGGATTNQSYSYKDALGCYARVVSATNGTIVNNTTTVLCAAPQ